MSLHPSQEVERTPPDKTRSACEHFAENHRELPKVLSQTEWRVQQRLFPGAQRCFADFLAELDVHLRDEERITSTVLDAFDATLSAQIRLGNEILRRMAALAQQAIQAQDCELFASITSDLLGTLAAHRDQEERRVFPLLEQLSRRGEEDVGPAPTPQSGS